MFKWNLLKIVFLSTLSFALMITPAFAEKRIYATWDSLEVDRLASIWLIKKFIDPNAVIRIFPKGTLIKEGIQFDTPYANIKRTHNQSTFEYLLSHYKIQDRKLKKIGKIMHDIEINVWEPKVFKESFKIKKEVAELVETSKNNQDAIEKAMTYFDELYSKTNIDSASN